MASTAARADRFRPLCPSACFRRPDLPPPVEGGPVAPPAYSPLVAGRRRLTHGGRGEPPAEAELAQRRPPLSGPARRYCSRRTRGGCCPNSSAGWSGANGRRRRATWRASPANCSPRTPRGGPVRVRVAPGDARSLRLDLPVLADPALAPGDCRDRRPRRHRRRELRSAPGGFPRSTRRRARVTAELRTAVGTALLGRALDARGRALDGGAAPGGLPRPG